MMASTKPIRTEYSTKLDGMITCIRDFLSKNLDDEVISRTHKGIADFCYKNDSIFKGKFLRRAGLKKLKTIHGNVLLEDEVNNFIHKLTTLNGECIFILKDTYDIMNLYQKRTGYGFGILVSRKFLCITEEDYFMLIETVYNSIYKSNNIFDLSEKYFVEFGKLIKNDKHFF